MNVVALDISSTRVGVAAGDASSPPRCSSFVPQGSTRGAKGSAYERWLRDVILLERPMLLAYEAPVIGAGGDISKHLLQIGLAFLTETVAQGRATCAPVAVQTARKAFVGHGRPPDPKKVVMAMCRNLEWDFHGAHDEADACAVWCWAHLNRGNARAMHKLLSAQRLAGMRAGR